MADLTELPTFMTFFKDTTVRKLMDKPPYHSNSLSKFYDLTVYPGIFRTVFLFVELMHGKG